MFQLSGSYFRASGVGGEDLEFQLNTGLKISNRIA